ncbi:MAG: hypothetical protein WA139_05780 [Candidatus Aenigmatarchaeota archaeon]
MKKEERLADVHSKIWFFHDERKFEKLEKSAIELFLAMNFPEKESAEAGKRVANAYIFYDKAGMSAAEGHDEKREYFLKKVLKEEIKIRTLLNEDIRAAYCENRWWKEFQNRNYLGVFPYILRQEMIKYRGHNPLIPFLSVYYLIKAGFTGHNKRNIDVAAQYLEKYWEITLKHMKDKIQY